MTKIIHMFKEWAKFSPTTWCDRSINPDVLLADQYERDKVIATCKVCLNRRLNCALWTAKRESAVASAVTDQLRKLARKTKGKKND